MNLSSSQIKVIKFGLISIPIYILLNFLLLPEDNISEVVTQDDLSALLISVLSLILVISPFLYYVWIRKKIFLLFLIIALNIILFILFPLLSPEGYLHVIYDFAYVYNLWLINLLLLCILIPKPLNFLFVLIFVLFVTSGLQTISYFLGSFREGDTYTDEFLFYFFSKPQHIYYSFFYLLIFFLLENTGGFRNLKNLFENDKVQDNGSFVVSFSVLYFFIFFLFNSVIYYNTQSYNVQSNTLFVRADDINLFSSLILMGLCLALFIATIKSRYILIKEKTNWVLPLSIIPLVNILMLLFLWKNYTKKILFLSNIQFKIYFAVLFFIFSTWIILEDKLIFAYHQNIYYDIFLIVLLNSLMTTMLYFSPSFWLPSLILISVFIAEYHFTYISLAESATKVFLTIAFFYIVNESFFPSKNSKGAIKESI